MITPILQNISFGKTMVGQYRIQRTLPVGKVNIPVRIYRLDDDKDYGHNLDYDKIKHISLFNFFDGKQSKTNRHIDYIAEAGINGKLVGIATCKEFDDIFSLQAIGTDNKKCYKGIGRALLAGITEDIKGKYPELNIFNALPSSYGFYTKCHFKKMDKAAFTLKEDDYNRLINDAQTQFTKKLS